MKKEKILELYENYIDAIYSSTMNEDKLKLSKEISDLTDKFYLTLTKEQEKILKELQEKEAEKQELVYRNVFVFAFSLGIDLFAEGLENGKMIKKR